MKAPSEKKSAANQRKEHNVDKYTFIGLGPYNAVAENTGLSSFVCCCCLPNLRTPAIFFDNIRTYNTSSLSKVIDRGANQKRICNFLLVINSNFGHISYRFRDIDAFNSKIACHPIPPLFDAP